MIAALLRLQFLLAGNHCDIQKVSGLFPGEVYFVQEFSHLFHTVASYFLQQLRWYVIVPCNLLPLHIPYCSHHL
uniref:Putative secreted protein n=1 Tax=Xenopsylla cheopis TaxID=163159 RepID=A0A6M2E407_XENCH